MKKIAFFVIYFLLFASTSYSQPVSIHGFPQGLSATDSPTFAGLTLNGALDVKRGTSAGLIRIYEPSGSGANYLGLTVPAMAGDTTYTLFTAYPLIANAPAICSTNGTFSWGDQALQTTSSPTFAGLALGSGSITMTGSLAATASRVTKGWFTNLEITNAPTINGAAWTTILQPLNTNLTDISSITMAKGYMIYYNGSNTIALAPLGTNAFGLGMTGTVPTWYWLTASKPVCTDASGLPGVCAGTEGVWSVAAGSSSIVTVGALTSGSLATGFTPVTVPLGGTGLSAGTEGGIPWFTTTTALASSALLAANAVMVGGGADAAPNTITSTATSGYVFTAQGVGVAPIWSGTLTGTFGGFTASRAVYSDASGNLVSHATLTDTELGYLDGVTAPTGSGALVLQTSPELTTPTAGGVKFGGVAQQSPAGTVRLSSADGGAFLWDTGKDFTAYAAQAGGSVNVSRYKIVVYDNANLYAVAYAGDLSTGETLAAENITNGDMELDSNWANVGTPSAQARSDVQAHAGTYSRLFTVDAADEGIQSDVFIEGISSGAMGKIDIWVYPPSTTVTIKARAADDSGWAFSENVTGLTASLWNQITRYYTDITVGASYYIIITSGAATSGTWYVDDVSAKQVTGVTATQGIFLNSHEESGVDSLSIVGGAGAVPAAFNVNGTLTYKIIALF